MIFCEYRGAMFSEHGRTAARRYAADLFGWCSACRDYPYSQHPEPAPHDDVKYLAYQIRARVLREFNRSNPGHEINPT